MQYLGLCKFMTNCLNWVATVCASLVNGKCHSTFLNTLPVMASLLSKSFVAQFNALQESILIVLHAALLPRPLTCSNLAYHVAWGKCNNCTFVIDLNNCLISVQDSSVFSPSLPLTLWIVIAVSRKFQEIFASLMATLVLHISLYSLTTFLLISKSIIIFALISFRFVFYWLCKSISNEISKSIKVWLRFASHYVLT